MIDHEHQLRAAGLRVTRPRTAVLEAVSTRPHADSATIVALVGELAPTVSRQAVFDCLNACTAAGLLRRIEPAGMTARYELRVGDNHHHLICRSCGTVVDIECALGAAPCLAPADDHGFVIDEAEVTHWGMCPACSARTEAMPGTEPAKGMS